MALRSVVLAPPPGTGTPPPPRRTVVLRPGAPADKGHAADLVTGVLGAALLLLCVALVILLPHKDYAVPQFRVTFPDNDTQLGTQSFDFTRGAAQHDFAYELPDNTASLVVVPEFKDDQPASDPDTFSLQLFDPQGNPVGPKTILTNAEPIPPQNNPSNLSGVQTDYAAQQFSQPVSFNLGDHPEEQIVAGLSRTEIKQQVQARIEPQHRLHTAGTWTVRVQLVQARGCADPSQQGADYARILACRQKSNDGSDAGNALSIANITFTTYNIQVQELH